MEFIYTKPLNGKTKMVTVKHGEETTEWMIQNYRNFTPNEFVFGDLNRALAALSPEDQSELWYIYQTIAKDMLEVSNLTRLDRKIQMNLQKIEKILPYDTISRMCVRENTLWIPKETGVDTPVDVQLASFQDVEESPVSRLVTGLTYTDDDIVQLNVLTIYMKLYLPILSHYYNLIANDTIEFFKCSKTIQLLEKMELQQSAGYARLLNYVDHFWSGRNRKVELSPSILLKGLSKEGAVNWIFSELLFKRLIPIGVSHRYHEMDDKQRPNFLKGLFHNALSLSDILARGERTGSMANEYYMNKSNLNDEAGDDSQTSLLETYKVTNDLGEVTQVTNCYFLERLELMLPHVDPTLDPKRVEDVVFNRAYHKSYHPFRIHLMEWVCGQLMSPGFTKYLTDLAYENVFRLTYALLVHWGYDDLAKILDGHYDHYNPERDLIFSTLDVSADQVKKLNELYPHGITSNRVKGESKRNSNYVILACQEMEDYVRGVRFEGWNTRDRWTCDINVRYRLAELIIMMNEKSFI